MATFTRNAWVTGETITADGLNGAKGFTLNLTSEEEENADWTVEAGELSDYDLCEIRIMITDEEEGSHKVCRAPLMISEYNSIVTVTYATSYGTLQIYYNAISHALSGLASSSPK